MKLQNISFLNWINTPNFLSMSKGSMEKDIESLFLIVTKSSIFFICMEEVEAKQLLNDYFSLLEISTYLFQLDGNKMLFLRILLNRNRERSNQKKKKKDCQNPPVLEGSSKKRDVLNAFRQQGQHRCYGSIFFCLRLPFVNFFHKGAE